MDNEKLLEIGNLWEKHGKRRVYIDEDRFLDFLDDDYWFQRYRTGNISYATKNGEQISNSKMQKLLSEFAGTKIWYDLESKKWNFKTYGNESLCDEVIRNIRKYLGDTHET